jgi:hypothetical protein
MQVGCVGRATVVVRALPSVRGTACLFRLSLRRVCSPNLLASDRYDLPAGLEHACELRQSKADYGELTSGCQAVQRIVSKNLGDSAELAIVGILDTVLQIGEY